MGKLASDTSRWSSGGPVIGQKLDPTNQLDRILPVTDDDISKARKHVLLFADPPELPGGGHDFTEAIELMEALGIWKTGEDDVEPS